MINSSPLTSPPSSPEAMHLPPSMPAPALISVPTPVLPTITLASSMTDWSSDSSDSKLDHACPVPVKSMDNIQYVPAIVKGRKGSHAPVLLVGHIKITIVCIFENLCCRFFQNKKKLEDKQVLSIIYNFESSTVQAWVNTHHDRLIGLTFVEFIIEFKMKFLPANWKDDLVATQIAMQSMQAFLTWMEATHEANAELGIANLDYHIPEERLCAHFVPHLSPTLKTSYDANNTHGALNSITDLEA